MPWGGDNHAPDHKGWSLVKSTPAPDPSKDDTGGADLRGDAEGAQAPQGSQVSLRLFIKLNVVVSLQLFIKLNVVVVVVVVVVVALATKQTS